MHTHAQGAEKSLSGKHRKILVALLTSAAGMAGDAPCHTLGPFSPGTACAEQSREQKRQHIIGV